MSLQLASRRLALDEPLVMGILNVTPDSFSDGGRWLSVDTAVEHAARMLAEGAALIDVGGESTRPGAAEVGEAEERDRVLPVIEALKQRFDCVLSIDTMKPAVMRAAVAAGAEMINDVNALRAEGALSAAANSGAAVCLMHMQGTPRSMQQAPTYGDVVEEVKQELVGRISACLAAGISADRIVIDPGIGFGKSLEHNLRLLANLDEFQTLGCPLLLGASRKSLFQKLLGLAVQDRLIPSVSVAALAVFQGVAMVRTHDVAETVQAIRTASAVLSRRAHKMQGGRLKL